MVGRAMGVEQVMAEVLADRVFYDESGGGATLSGGEPLMQPAFCRAVLQACRAHGVHTALDTAGYAAEDDLLAAACLADLVLYDLKLMDDRAHREHTGASNEPILRNLRALGRVHQNIWIRVPLVPGVNDSPEELQAIGRFVAAIPGVQRVSVLPYHKLGTHKAAGLQNVPPSPEVAIPTADDVARAAERLRACGLFVYAGG